MVSNGSSLHLSNLHLHNVFEETSSNQIVKLTFVAGVLSFVFAHLIVQIVDVVRQIVSHDACCPCLQLEHDRISMGVRASSVDLRSEENFSRTHVPEVVFLVECCLLFF